MASGDRATRSGAPGLHYTECVRCIGTNTLINGQKRFVLSYNDLEAPGVVQCIKYLALPDPAGRCLKCIEFSF